MGKRWLKVAAEMPRDAKLVELNSDAARWAFVAILCAAKEQTPGGRWVNRKHLVACIRPSEAKHIGALIGAGLLSEDETGIEVSGWAKWQIDPTGNERLKRFRETEKQRPGNAGKRPENDTDTETETENLISRPKRFSTPQSIGNILGVKP